MYKLSQISLNGFIDCFYVAVGGWGGTSFCFLAVSLAGGDAVFPFTAPYEESNRQLHDTRL